MQERSNNVITLNKEEILLLEPIKDGLSGEFGGVRYYDDNTLIKMLYDTPKAKEVFKIIKARINGMLDVKIDDVSFPIDVTSPEIRDYFAYTMPKINGINYEVLLKDIRLGKTDMLLNDLSINYHNAQNKIFEVTSNDILIWDLKPDNCCLTNSLGFGIYDVDFFKKGSFECLELLENNEWFLNYTFELFLRDVLGVLKIPIKHCPKDKNKIIIMENYVDNLLEEIVRKTSSNTKSLGEILRK